MKTSELLPADTLRVIADIAREAIGNFRRGKTIRLLTENTKLSKVPGVPGRGWLLRGLAMAPADVGGHEACYLAFKRLHKSLQRIIQRRKQYARHAPRDDRTKDTFLRTSRRF